MKNTRAKAMETTMTLCRATDIIVRPPIGLRIIDCNTRRLRAAQTYTIIVIVYYELRETRTYVKKTIKKTAEK